MLRKRVRWAAVECACLLLGLWVVQSGLPTLTAAIKSARANYQGTVASAFPLDSPERRYAEVLLMSSGPTPEPCRVVDDFRTKYAAMAAEVQKKIRSGRVVTAWYFRTSEGCYVTDIEDRP